MDDVAARGAELLRHVDVRQRDGDRRTAASTERLVFALCAIQEIEREHADMVLLTCRQTSFSGDRAASPHLSNARPEVVDVNLE